MLKWSPDIGLDVFCLIAGTVLALNVANKWGQNKWGQSNDSQTSSP